MSNQKNMPIKARKVRRINFEGLTVSQKEHRRPVSRGLNISEFEKGVGSRDLIRDLKPSLQMRANLVQNFDDLIQEDWSQPSVKETFEALLKQEMAERSNAEKENKAVRGEILKAIRIKLKEEATL